MAIIRKSSFRVNPLSTYPLKRREGLSLGSIVERFSYDFQISNKNEIHTYKKCPRY